MNDEILTELRKQTNILDQLYDKSLYSYPPFASLLMSEVNSYEDMDGNNLLFCVDFIFNVPYNHLSPMLQNICQMQWSSHTEEDYNEFLEQPGPLLLLSFEEYRDGLSNDLLKHRVDAYIKNYKRIVG